MVIANKPRLVCVPFPLQGHINPMLRLARLLHHKGFHITFVNTEFNHKRMLDARGGPGALNGLPDFCFETLPIEHPSSVSHTSLAVSLHLMRESCRKDFLPLLRNLLAKLNDKNVPPVTSVVSDFFLANAVAVGEELGIPTVLLCTISASALESFNKFLDLLAQYLTAPNDASNKDQAETIVNWIPGTKDAGLKDIMSIIGNKDPRELIMQSNESDTATASRASAVIIHTFEYLEKAQLVAVSSTNGRIFAIGPLQLLLNHIPEDPEKLLDCEMWEEQSEYIQWLNSREPKSVIYVNFGSTMFMSAEQLIELAWGIAESNHYFLWVIRPDMLRGDGTILTQEFLSETNERGLLLSWCQQETVLNHPSVGGFITHCGWNSTLESIAAGVPMICLPLGMDQQTNAQYICNEWGIGLQLSHNFKRNELVKLVKDLMAGEKGKELQEKALEWKKLAEDAAGSVGSSSSNLNKLVEEVLLPKRY